MGSRSWGVQCHPHIPEEKTALAAASRPAPRLGPDASWCPGGPALCFPPSCAPANPGLGRDVFCISFTLTKGKGPTSLQVLETEYKLSAGSPPVWKPPVTVLWHMSPGLALPTATRSHMVQRVGTLRSDTPGTALIEGPSSHLDVTHALPLAGRWKEWGGRLQESCELSDQPLLPPPHGQPVHPASLRHGPPWGCSPGAG